MYWDPTGHWEENDSNRSVAAQAQILEATKAYIAAKANGDTKGMEDARNKAQDARNGIIYQDNSKVSSITIGNELSAVLSSSYVTQAAKNDARKSDMGFAGSSYARHDPDAHIEQVKIIDQINNARKASNIINPNGPPIQGDFYQIVNGTSIKSYYRQLNINKEKRWVLTPHDFEEYYYANAYQMSPGELADWVVGMTPADWAKDSADLIAGKNLFTGEEQSFWLSAACLIGPEAVDQLLKQGKKAVKNAAQAVTNKRVGTLFENYVEATKLKNVDFETQKLRDVYDEAGNLHQVKPDFEIFDNNLNRVAVADAKTAITGHIPFDEQAQNLIRFAANDTTKKRLIYYIPEGISPIITKDFFQYASINKVKIQFVVVK